MAGFPFLPYLRKNELFRYHLEEQIRFSKKILCSSLKSKALISIQNAKAWGEFKYKLEVQNQVMKNIKILTETDSDQNQTSEVFFRAQQITWCLH